MKAIRPKKAVTTFIYDCPHCELEIEVSAKVASQIGKCVCQFCDGIIALERINTTYSLSTKKEDKPKTVETKVTVEKQKVTRSPLMDDCIGALVNLGYKKKNATNIVDQYFVEHNPSSINDALNGIFSWI
jgi:transcription elongation factor Elf1